MNFEIPIHQVHDFVQFLDPKRKTKNEELFRNVLFIRSLPALVGDDRAGRIRGHQPDNNAFADRNAAGRPLGRGYPVIKIVIESHPIKTLVPGTSERVGRIRPDFEKTYPRGAGQRAQQCSFDFPIRSRPFLKLIAVFIESQFQVLGGDNGFAPSGRTLGRQKRRQGEADQDG